MAESVIKNYFPSQVVSDVEKLSFEYGLKVAKAIEKEWFDNSQSNKYVHNQNNFHNLRLYARGEQPIQKYKDELSITHPCISELVVHLARIIVSYENYFGYVHIYYSGYCQTILFQLLLQPSNHIQNLIFLHH